MENKGFNYVNITTKGCDGWLNLFYGDYIVALVRVAAIANDIRSTTPERKKDT